MIVLTHTLYLNQPTGEIPIEIQIHKPLLEDGCWKCWFDIDWPEGRETNWGAGHDALQALILTLRMIGIKIYTSQYHKDGALRAYERGEDGYGFPVPQNSRDLLIGVDKMAF